MKTIGNNIAITRGEVFVLARELVYKNGAPYVLRSQLQNPYIIITISSNTYKMQGKYFRRYWLDLSTYPKFETAEICDISEQNLSENTLPSGYTASRCIYRYIYPSGAVEYYRYVGTSPTGEYEPYSFSFIQTFSNIETKSWIESNYLYEINIVSGELTETYLTETFKSLFSAEDVPENMEDIYKAIAKEYPDWVANVCVDAPICNFITNDVILQPSKLIIYANA